MHIFTRLVTCHSIWLMCMKHKQRVSYEIPQVPHGHRKVAPPPRYMAGNTISSHTRPQTHTSICQRCTHPHKSLRSAITSYCTTYTCLGSQSTQPMGACCFTIGWVVLEMAGRTFSFIGLPRDVIVLSVSIGPLLLSHIMVYCSVTASARVHYPHPSLLKTSRPDRHMKERQQVHFIISWSINCIRSGRGMPLMALVATTKDIQSPSL